MISEGYYDEQNRVNVRSVSNVSRIDHSLAREVQYVIDPSAPGGLPVNVLYAPEDSETLLVSFHGSLQRSKYKLPRFEWRKTLSRLRTARLMVADTTLQLNPSMPLGWYIGTSNQDLTAEIAQTVQGVARTGGYSRIVLAGSSGGGYAAMAVSHLIPGTAAVCFSPQTRIGDYTSWVHKAFVSAAFPGYESIDMVESHYPERVNLRTRYSQRGANYVHYVQNTNDRMHYEQHYLPFARMLEVDPAIGGLDQSGSVRILPEALQKGHQPPSRGRFIHHINEAHIHMFGQAIARHPTHAIP